MASRRLKFRAFTLIEMLMVMAIIAICAALAAPRLGDFASGRANYDVARSIVSLASYARAQAIGEGRSYRLNYDESGRQFYLTAQDAGQYVAPVNEYGRKIVLPDGVTAAVQFPAEQDGVYVLFDATGRTQQGTIRLTDRRNRIVEVACDSPTELFRVLPSAEVQR